MHDAYCFVFFCMWGRWGCLTWSLATDFSHVNFTQWTFSDFEYSSGQLSQWSPVSPFWKHALIGELLLISLEYKWGYPLCLFSNKTWSFYDPSVSFCCRCEAPCYVDFEKCSVEKAYCYYYSGLGLTQLHHRCTLLEKTVLQSHTHKLCLTSYGSSVDIRCKQSRWGLSFLSHEKEVEKKWKQVKQKYNFVEQKRFFPPSHPFNHFLWTLLVVQKPGSGATAIDNTLEVHIIVSHKEMISRFNENILTHV